MIPVLFIFGELSIWFLAISSLRFTSLDSITLSKNKTDTALERVDGYSKYGTFAVRVDK